MGTALFVAFVGLLLIACLLAFWRGGGPERAVALLFVAAWFASMANRMLMTDFHYRDTPKVTLAIDILLLIALLAVSRRANRAWPVVVTSLQLLVVLAHAARVINQHQLPFIYIVMTEFWPYLQVIALIVGTMIHSNRSGTGGAGPSWKN